MHIDDILARLEGVKRQGKGYVAKCPAHTDKRPSLGVREGTDGRTLVCCYAGCEFSEIVNALRLKPSDLMPPSRDQMRRVWKKENIDVVYPYHDLNGKLAYQVVRRPGKKFMQRHRNDAREWVWNMEGVQRLLFRLPHVYAAIQSGDDVYLCEGEKDALAVVEAGACGTSITGGVIKQTGPVGVKMFERTYAPFLRGAHVKLCIDSDAAGEAHAKQVLKALTGIAASVTVFRAARGNDVSDHLEAGLTLGDLERARDLEPDLGLTITIIADVVAEPVKWLWEPYLPRRYATLFDGDGDTGKSYASLGLAACISNGVVPTGENAEPGNVLLFASEDEARDTIRPRLELLGADMTKIIHIADLFPLDGIGLDKIERLHAEYRPLLTIFDPILAYVGAAVNINAANEVRPVFDGLRRIYSRHDTAGWHIRHERKPDPKAKGGATGHHEGLGSVDIRNIHRSQLIVRWHPDELGLRVLSHEKHNLSEQGDCFGFRWTMGEFSWLPFIERPESWGDKPALGGYEWHELKACKLFVEEMLMGESPTQSAMNDARRARKYNMTVYRAACREMRVTVTRSAGKVLISLPENYMPFADDGETDQEDRHWVGK